MSGTKTSSSQEIRQHRLKKQIYVVVTVAKNEEKFITDTILSIANQSILPKYHMIVDDGSTDSTREIIQKYAQRFPWIKCISLPPSTWDIGVHYSYICRCGFEAVLSLCKEEGIAIDNICLVDADTIIEKDYFKKIFYKFSEDTRLGIVSGGIYHYIDGRYICKNIRLDCPSGTTRCWCKKCYDESGGYLLDITPDYISTIRSRHMGWKTLRCPEILVVEQRLDKMA